MGAVVDPRFDAERRLDLLRTTDRRYWWVVLVLATYSLTYVAVLHHAGLSTPRLLVIVIAILGMGSCFTLVKRWVKRTGRPETGFAIVNPLGGRIMKQASMDGPELLVTEIDLDDVDKARRSLPWWRDRRPDLYGNLDPI